MQEADDLLDENLPPYEMIMEGKLPRFIPATPEYLRQMSELATGGGGGGGEGAGGEGQAQELGPRGGGLKRKKRKGKWA
jgi:hypothetical protein|eukprot:COSAG06_NODE_27847_length_585_cov_1.106996_1_plen_79_part_00